MSPTYCANDDFWSLGDTIDTLLFNIFTNILHKYDTRIWYTNTIHIYCTNNDLGQDKPSPALTSAPVSITMILTHTPNICICKFALLYKMFHKFKIYTLKNTITIHISYVHVMTWGHGSSNTETPQRNFIFLEGLQKNCPWDYLMDFGFVGYGGIAKSFWRFVPFSLLQRKLEHPWNNHFTNAMMRTHTTNNDANTQHR